MKPGARITSYISDIDMNPSFIAVTISVPGIFGSISLCSQFPYIDDAGEPTSLNKI